MEEVTLFQMLEARERRAENQRLLLEAYRCPLICFTMNIPGPVKNSALIRRAFDWGCRGLEASLEGYRLLHREYWDEVTGCEAFYAIDAPAEELKRICTGLEESNGLGRLFDMDVLDAQGRKLSRGPEAENTRNCIVCGAPGRGCASRRVHNAVQLQSAANDIMVRHFAREDREKIAALAVQALLDEVHTTPKPGLVDERNSGSHEDMDLRTFTASAEALRPYFAACVKLGQELAGERRETLFSQLRRAGLEAEQRMYQATGGVNTHKGAIFTMGILCGCLGRLWKPEKPVVALQVLLEECAEIARIPLERDFQQLGDTGNTAGEKLYLTRGITGIRGEAAAGLPSVSSFGLPVLKEGISRGMTRNDAGAAALMHLMAWVEDTNLRHRGGEEGARWAVREVEKLLSKKRFPSVEDIEKLDDAFIERNLSPGGCADLLAVSYFLYDLEQTNLKLMAIMEYRDGTMVDVSRQIKEGI